MYKKDFIMRMIEMLAEMIAGILGLIKKGDYDKASQKIENAYQDFLKQNAASFNNIPLENLTDTLFNEHQFNVGQMEILSELFYAEAELKLALNQKEESLNFYRKSLILLEFVIAESRVFSFEKESKVSYLHKQIDNLEKGI